MTRSSDRTADPRPLMHLRAAALAPLLALAILAALPSRATAMATRTESSAVVKQATRGSFGRILTTVGGRTLYIHPNGPCTGSCLTIWPPLLMPRGKTIPTGSKGLRTVRLANGRLQVTYRHHRLYRFANDSGTSVNGNGVAGFVVAKVV